MLPLLTFTLAPLALGIPADVAFKAAFLVGEQAAAVRALAGADLDLARAVGYMNGQIGVELGEALRMASLYPAEAAQMPPLTGRIAAGSRADMVWFSDQIKARKTWIGGIEITAGA